MHEIGDKLIGGGVQSNSEPDLHKQFNSLNSINSLYLLKEANNHDVPAANNNTNVNKVNKSKKKCANKQQPEVNAQQLQFEKSLMLAKEQYNRDLQFLHGRHTEKINRLQNIHEESINETVKQYETKLHDLEQQLKAFPVQKKALQQFLQCKEAEVDKLKSENEKEKLLYEKKINKFKECVVDKEEFSEDYDLKKFLEISKKRCFILEKINEDLEATNDELNLKIKEIKQLNEVKASKDRVDFDLYKTQTLQIVEDLKKQVACEKVSKQIELNKIQLNFEREKKLLTQDLTNLQLKYDELTKKFEDLQVAQISSSPEQLKDIYIKSNLTELKKKHQLELAECKKSNQLELKKYKEEIQVYHHKYEDVKLCCNQLESIIKVLNKDNKKLEGDVEETKTKCDEIIANMRNELVISARYHEHEAMKLKQELEEQKECFVKIIELKQELEYSKKDLENNLATKTKKSGKDVAKIKKQLDVEKKYHDEIVKRLKKDLEHHRKEKVEFEEKINKLKRELDHQTKRVDNFKKIKEDLEKSHEDLKLNLEELKRDAPKFKKDLICKLKQSNEEDQTKLPRPKKLDLHTSTIDILPPQPPNYKEEFDKLKNESKRTDNIIYMLMTKLEAAEKKCDDYNKLKISISSQTIEDEPSPELLAIKQHLSLEQQLRQTSESQIQHLQSTLEETKKIFEACLNTNTEKINQLEDALQTIKNTSQLELTDLQTELDLKKKNHEEQLVLLHNTLEIERKNFEEQTNKLNKEIEVLKQNDEKQFEEKKSEQENILKMKKSMANYKRQYEQKIELMKQDLDKGQTIIDKLIDNKISLENEQKLQEKKMLKMKKNFQETLQKYNSQILSGLDTDSIITIKKPSTP